MNDLDAFRRLGLWTKDSRILGRGSNGVVIEVSEQGNKPFVAKNYRHNRHHKIDRMAREFSSLQYLSGEGFSDVPDAYEMFSNERVATYELMAGSQPNPETNVVVHMLSFVRRLELLYQSPPCSWSAAAVEACLGAADISEQITGRINRALREPAMNQELNLTLRDLQATCEAAFAAVNRHHEFKRMTLTSSDFGPHNMLLHEDLVSFVDFEYFGVDSAARVIADVVWHPGSKMSAAHRIEFARGAFQFFSLGHPDFHDEVCVILPLIGVRWASIMLRKFPESVSRIQSYLDYVRQLISSKSSLENAIERISTKVAR